MQCSNPHIINTTTGKTITKRLLYLLNISTAKYINIPHIIDLINHRFQETDNFCTITSLACWNNKGDNSFPIKNAPIIFPNNIFANMSSSDLCRIKPILPVYKLQFSIIIAINPIENNTAPNNLDDEYKLAHPPIPIKTPAHMLCFFCICTTLHFFFPIFFDYCYLSI